MLATLPDGDEVVYSDGVFGQVMDRPDAVDTIRSMWDRPLSEALPEGASLELTGNLGSEL
ncbi:hypothetical protein GCM10010429_32280 [Micromonospora olivasterospora]|uniref:DUF5753 domain-containing protein n=1 Tax=Micromonospora olivasterospora TaxID=1880 RepID=A0A562I6V8_MICOL|nr:Scr1 family TA system antitoxin-like transcriptional regulator [Micromonospora olivasterospora]TWH66403.1 hypothetical protein JD77_01355 [Micromonospora olivasterospora]